MSLYTRSHVPDDALLRDAPAHLRQEATACAALLADLAEIESRKLYLPAGYPSMRTWCVGALGLTDEAGRKRLHAARTAQRFPALFTAVAEGRLYLSAVVLLAPHLTAANMDELIDAAAFKSKAEIAHLLARQSSGSAMPIPVSTALCTDACAPGRTNSHSDERGAAADAALAGLPLAGD